MSYASTPPPQGLYDPRQEHDSCGIGFVANIKNHKSHAIIQQGLQILTNLNHRGAVGADPLAGDGAGILIQIPDQLLRAECAALGITLPAPGDYAVGMVFFPPPPGDPRRLRSGLCPRLRRRAPDPPGLARRAHR